MDHIRELASSTAVRIWLIRTDAGYEDAVASALLDRDEQLRAMTFRFERDRTRYVTAHLALRTILAEALDCHPASLQFIRRPCPECGELHGRPAVADASETHFSLSHSGNLALVALASTLVGADVEALPSSEAAAELIAALHPRERAELAELSDPLERRLALARVWVRKEAFLKGLGTGLSRRLDLDYVGSLPHLPGSPQGWAVSDVPVPDGYSAAVVLSPPVQLIVSE
ncbi:MULTISPECIES: 4'-phosphopantetheinyl transferase family protein [unclassified Streptomyces]|uniref:4'-phosphopantetheinyl transferase family protein n=1 Tax=unclassified Streptomyces TaxID=2593676 RepID=UPI0036E4A416